jgi:predicted acyl esterase
MDGTWRCADAFPPLDATPLTLYPQADGALGAQPGEGSASFTDVEAGGMAPIDQLPYALAITERTRVYGTPEVALDIATTSAYNAHVHAALALVRDGDVEEITWGYQSLRHRDGLEAGQPITPGTAYDITFKMYPIDLVLEPGDELVFIVRGANGPLANVQVLPNPQPGSLTLTLGEATFLTLPTTPLERTFEPLAPDALPENYLLPESARVGQKTNRPGGWTPSPWNGSKD